MARRVRAEHRSWAEIGGTEVRDARVRAVDCGVGKSCSCYVRVGVGGVRDAMGAASGGRESRAGRCSPFDRCALVRNERFSDPQGDDDLR